MIGCHDQSCPHHVGVCASAPDVERRRSARDDVSGPRTTTRSMRSRATTVVVPISEAM